MKYTCNIRIRPELEVSMEKQHEKIIACLKNVPGLLGIARNKECQPPSFGDHFMATFRLKGKMEGITYGHLNYRFRNKLEDHYMSDDVIMIDFSAKKIGLRYLMESVQMYIECIGPYSVDIFPIDLTYTEYYRNVPFSIRKLLNYRKDIKMFYPFQYMDRLLVERIFKCDALDLCRKLNGRIYNVELFNEGVLIQGFDHYATVEESLTYNLQLASLLGIGD